MTGAAPPPPSILAQIEKQGFEKLHTHTDLQKFMAQP